MTHSEITAAILDEIASPAPPQRSLSDSVAILALLDTISAADPSAELLASARAAELARVRETLSAARRASEISSQFAAQSREAVNVASQQLLALFS